MTEDDLLSLLPERLALPRGRSALPQSVVDESRRGRIMQATLNEVAEVGYSSATVATIIKRARVSRTSFYEAFADKEDAFAAAHWHASDLAVAEVWTPALARPGIDFDGRVRHALNAYINALEHARSFTICFFVEIRGGGERLATQREEILERHAQILHELAKASAKADPTLCVPDHDVLRALMGAFDELVAHEVRIQRRADRLDLRPAVAPFATILMAVMHDT